MGALAHLGLDCAYAVQGDTTKARTAYQDFFTLWKDADPNIPILQQAKADYGSLNASKQTQLLRFLCVTPQKSRSRK